MYRNVLYSFLCRATGAPSHFVGEEQGIGEEDQDRGSLIRCPDLPITESIEFGVQPCCIGSVEVAAATSPISRSAGVIPTVCVDVG